MTDNIQPKRRGRPPKNTSNIVSTTTTQIPSTTPTTTNTTNKNIVVQTDNSIAHEIIDLKVSDALRTSYQTYSEYIAQGRALVGINDGFKNVYRRILFAALHICRDKRVKSATLSGEVMGKYHPHGDAYQSIVKMVGQGFLIGKGSFKNTAGVEPTEASASRYTEVMLNPLSEMLFLNRELLPFVDWQDSDLGYKEPVYLPALIPGTFTSLSETSEFDSGIGVQIKAVYPRFSVKSLLEYALRKIDKNEFIPGLLYYKFHKLTKQCSNDNIYKYKEEFECTHREEKESVYITSVLPFVDMAKRLRNIPYKDLTNIDTNILIPKKDFVKDLFKTEVKFESYAFSMNNDKIAIHPFTPRVGISMNIYNLKNIIFPRYFKDAIDKITIKIEELKKVKEIKKKIKDNNILNFEGLTQEEKSLCNRYSISSLIQIDEKIEVSEKELATLINRSKDIANEVYILYKEAYGKV